MTLFDHRYLREREHLKHRVRRAPKGTKTARQKALRKLTTDELRREVGK